MEDTNENAMAITKMERAVVAGVIRPDEPSGLASRFNARDGETIRQTSCQTS
jgi:hypothetical protein